MPIVPGQKRPAVPRWSAVPIDERRLESWSTEFSVCGVGLRTGRLVGVDIDILDADRAHAVETLVRRRLGDTPLMRVGMWPKRLLAYRTEQPFPKITTAGLEILGTGQQFVAFGIHPGTGASYLWPSGDTPLETALDALPCVTEAECRDLFGELSAFLPAPKLLAPKSVAGSTAMETGSMAPVRNEADMVVDGRDSWLSTIAFHAVQDALDRGQELEETALASLIWGRFVTTSDLERPHSATGKPYTFKDACRKLEDKLRLHRACRLPDRAIPTVEAAHSAPTMDVSSARARLDDMLATACRIVGDWHERRDCSPPRIGIRATVGLGKSILVRKHALALQAYLKATDAPDRILVVTPSHWLAEETATAWRKDGVKVAVYAGYHAKDPISGKPMCRDLTLVDAAISAELRVPDNVCGTRSGPRCKHFNQCPKQQNLAEVSRADVVVAAYDVLFTGAGHRREAPALIIVDEACWQRALESSRVIPVDQLVQGQDAGSDVGSDGIRDRLAQAVAAIDYGPVMSSDLVDAGLSVEDCITMADDEAQGLVAPRLRPGLDGSGRTTAINRARVHEQMMDRIRLWHALADTILDQKDVGRRIGIRKAESGRDSDEFVLTSVRRLHPTLQSAPVIHLDATLRPELAQRVLPGLKVQTVDARADHVTVRLIHSSFGKSSLCPDPRASEHENDRRANRLRDCVDHVRWHARRHAGDRTLVVTYAGCEQAFRGIPGVSTAHFNAISGLDCFRDVRLLIVVGRPLPSSSALTRLAEGFFGHPVDGSYSYATRGVLMRDGSKRAVRVITATDDRAELLRAAICDDELVQAIGRGRGINRTAKNPLDVHILADVALPLVYDRVLSWEQERPDIWQRMLLAGIAVTSPTDAFSLHPKLFSSDQQAKKALDRSGFKGQNPMINTYREMSLKSACYRLSGRGHGWARACWLDLEPEKVLAELNRLLGPIDGWQPDQQ